MHAVTADAGGAGIDDITNTRHGQGRFRHIGTEHHSPTPVGRKNAVLLRLAQSRIERQDFRVSQFAALQVMMHIANIPLAGQEHQYVPRHRQTLAALLALDFLQHVFNLTRQFLAFSGRPVAHFHRVGPPGNLQHRSLTEMPGKTFVVDGGRGNDEFQVRTPG